MMVQNVHIIFLSIGLGALMVGGGFYLTVLAVIAIWKAQHDNAKGDK